MLGLQLFTTNVKKNEQNIVNHLSICQ